MADTVTPEVRSMMMASIRGTDTRPERIARSYLHRHGFRFRKNVKDLPGKPDIVLPKYRTVVFVHGCFWHQHAGCPLASRPKSRTGYWDKKLDRNVERDREACRRLEAMGWKVLVIWECEVQDRKALSRLCSEIKSAQPLALA